MEPTKEEMWEALTARERGGMVRANLDAAFRNTDWGAVQLAYLEDLLQEVIKESMVYIEEDLGEKAHVAQDNYALDNPLDNPWTGPGGKL